MIRNRGGGGGGSLGYTELVMLVDGFTPAILEIIHNTTGGTPSLSAVSGTYTFTLTGLLDVTTCFLSAIADWTVDPNGPNGTFLTAGVVDSDTFNVVAYGFDGPSAPFIAACPQFLVLLRIYQ